MAQERLKDRKAESLFNQYAGHDLEGPDPDFMAEITAKELYTYPVNFIKAVKQQLESRLSPEHIAEKVLARQIGTFEAEQRFSGNQPDNSGNTLLEILDTEKILDNCTTDLIDYTEPFREEVLAILDFILSPEDIPDRLPPAPPSLSAKRKKG